jgi:predicted AAA+ superfamily ATPase
MATIIQEIRKKLDSFHYDDTDLHNNIMKLCEKENWRYKYKYNKNTCKCDFIIIHNNVVYMIQATIESNQKKKKELKMLNMHSCDMFYKKMKNKYKGFWEKKQISGITISQTGVELNCYNIGKNIIQCEGVINRDVYTNNGGVLYWS